MRLLVGPFGRYLLGAPFRLLHLSLVADWDEPLVLWLEEQRELRSLLYSGMCQTPLPLAPSALPNLSCVTTYPKIIGALVPGRPVREIVITCVEIEPEDPDFVDMARLCTQSTGPICSIEVLHCNRTIRPEHYFPFLNVIPQYLPVLPKFGLKSFAWPIDEHLCTVVSEFVSKFKELKNLEFTSFENDDLVHNAGEQRRLAEMFGGHCPTLRCVRFPGTLYTNTASGEWLTMSDILSFIKQFQQKMLENARLHEAEHAHCSGEKCGLSPNAENAVPRDNSGRSLHIPRAQIQLEPLPDDATRVLETPNIAPNDFDLGAASMLDYAYRYIRALEGDPVATLPQSG